MIAAHRHNSIVQISRYRKLGADDFRSQYHAAAKISGKADIVFLDPPYGRGLLTDALQMVAETGLLCEGGIAVAEHAIDEKMPESFGRLTLIKSKRYGKIGISVYENTAELEEE